MPLTTVSNAWREDGREAWLPSQGKPNRGRPALGQARVTGQGKDQGAEGHAGLRLERKENHLWAASARAVVKAVRCVSNRTRPVSWLGPETSGVHPHTKGARCSAGGHRHGIPSAQGASSRLARRQGVRKPLVTETRHTDQGNGGGRDSWSNDLLAPSPDGGQTERAHRCRRRRALWSPARCGTFASPSVKWPARQGEARIRTPWRQRAACAVRCAGPSGTRSAACPCSPGSASRTRTRRSCPCAAASARRTAGRPAPAAA